ncbi:hypothetical protein FRB99_004255, partial [Tulasnella sp. 403]
RHLGCVTAVQKGNVRRQLKSGQSALQGFDELKEEDKLVIRTLFDWYDAQSGNGQGQARDEVRETMSSYADEQPSASVIDADEESDDDFMQFPIPNDPPRDYDTDIATEPIVAPPIRQPTRATRPDADALITLGSPSPSSGLPKVPEPSPAPSSVAISVAQPLPPIPIQQAIMTPSIASQSTISSHSRYDGGHTTSAPIVGTTSSVEQLALE